MTKSRLIPEPLLPLDWRLDFTEVQIGDIYPSFDCTIQTVTVVVGTPTTTILLNGLAYSFGDPIAEGDVVNITVSVASVIDLNFDF